MISVAFEKTGLLVTKDNHDLLPDKDLAEWAAIDEYEAQPAGREIFEGDQDELF